MIGATLTRIHNLRARRDAADTEGRDHDAQRFDAEQMSLEADLRATLNTMLAGEGATVDQVIAVLS